jgi:hypothetical protein
MQLTIDIDDQLLQNIAEYEADKMPSTLVSEALQEYLQRRRRLAIKNEFGQYDFDPDYDAKIVRMLR